MGVLLSTWPPQPGALIPSSTHSSGCSHWAWEGWRGWGTWSSARLPLAPQFRVLRDLFLDSSANPLEAFLHGLLGIIMMSSIWRAIILIKSTFIEHLLYARCVLGAWNITAKKTMMSALVGLGFASRGHR